MFIAGDFISWQMSLYCNFHLEGVEYEILIAFYVEQFLILFLNGHYNQALLSITSDGLMRRIGCQAKALIDSATFEIVEALNPYERRISKRYTGVGWKFCNSSLSIIVQHPSSCTTILTSLIFSV